jgi:DNA polymerase III delta prime subunit
MLLAEKVYKENVFDVIEDWMFGDDGCSCTPVMLYGPESVGKTYTILNILRKKF